ncbi:hypothetical protein MRX96_014969 [Rhipicephalus microplus]
MPAGHLVLRPQGHGSRRQAAVNKELKAEKSGRKVAGRKHGTRAPSSSLKMDTRRPVQQGGAVDHSLLGVVFAVTTETSVSWLC